MNEQLASIKKSILNENISTSEILYLQEHKQDVLDTGDADLCQWAGISEEEFKNE